MDPIKSKASMIHFSEAHFEKNLTALKNTQESIQSLSNWCLQHKQHHKKIVNCWFKVMKKVKMESRLVLFYLANDVIQYSRRKNLEFINTWALFLQRAVTLVRDDKIKPNIQRIFKIWSNRGIFDDNFIADLTGLLESPKGVSSDTAKLVAEFQPMKLIDKIRSCSILENDTDTKLSNLKKSTLELTDVDALRNNLKDRRHGADHVTEVEDGIKKMEAYVGSLNEEIKDRAKLIELLEQGSVFYEHQKGEAKIVVNAYHNFGNRVKNLKRKLDEMIPTLPSPIPSPDINAPSPSPDSDAELELPTESAAGSSATNAPVGVSNTNAMGGTSNTFDLLIESHPVHSFMQNAEHQHLGIGSSFMGSGGLPFDIKASLFQETSSHSSQPLSDVPSTEGKPIEVINSCSKPTEGFNISEFLKSLGQTEATSSEPLEPSIPGLDGQIELRHHETGILKPASNSSIQFTQVENFSQSLYNMFSTPPPPPPASRSNSVAPVVQQPPPLMQESQSNRKQPPPALQPPPIPPDMFSTDNSQQWGMGYDEMIDQSAAPWNTKLPSKFPTWGDAADNWENDSMKDWETESMNKIPKLVDDTPMSPPMFEKESYNNPVEYDDRLEGIALEDVDHRTLMSSGRTVKKDVDHRNLISLTGSPAPHHQSQQKDLDFRVLGPPPDVKNEVIRSGQTDKDYRQPPIVPTFTPASPNPNDKGSGNFSDNVESVDMEMSDDENESKSSSASSQAMGSRRGESNAVKRNSNYQDKNKQKNSTQTGQTSQTNGPQRTSHPIPTLLPSPNIKPFMAATTAPPNDGKTAVKSVIPESTPKTPLLKSPIQSCLQSSGSHLNQNKVPLLSLPGTPLPHTQTMHPNFERPKQDEPSKEIPVKDNIDNGTEQSWEKDEDQFFIERLQTENFAEDISIQSSNCQIHLEGSAQPSSMTRGRRGNQMGASGSFGTPRGKPYQGEYSHRGGYNGPSSGFSGNRGFRGSYRPFRGSRRGRFTRW